MQRAPLPFLAAVAAAALWLPHAVSSGSAAPAGPATPGAGLVHEPLVVWDTSGPTAGGSVHRSLVVYTSGFVTVSKRDDDPAGTLVVDVQTASIGPARAQKLLLDLVAAGAASLADQTFSGPPDTVPLQTLTLLEGQGLALSWTFSYWFGAGAYAATDAVLHQFVAGTFPSF